MSNIIKSGVYIGNTEVTSEHIGKKVIVLPDEDGDSMASNKYQPVGYETTIIEVYDGYFYTEDNDGDLREVDADNCYKWATPQKPPVKSSKPQRQKLAKAIKEARKQLDEAVNNAKEVGMNVSMDGDTIKITYNPPMEEY